MSVCGPSVCEWLPCLNIFKAYWWCLLLSFQYVSGYHATLCFNSVNGVCSFLSSLWVAIVHCLHFKSIDDTCPWLSSLWVAILPLSSWLTTHVLVSPVCEWLMYHSGFQSSDDTCPLLFSKWVVTVPHWVSRLTTSALGSLESEWLLFLAVFYACWNHISHLSSGWVLIIPSNILTVIMVLVLEPSESQWFVMLQTCW